MIKIHYPLSLLFLFSFQILFANSLTQNSQALAREVIDLNDFEQSIVLETKKIDIPGYPHAFNPSIMKWKDNLLLCFRIRDPITASTDGVGFIWLDSELNPLGNPYILQTPIPKSSPGSWIQDPRIIAVGNKNYIVYSNRAVFMEQVVRRVFVAELQFDEENFFIHDPDCLLHFDGPVNRPQEKNWVPFDYKGMLLLAYSIDPHKIFFPLLGSDHCQTIATSESLLEWDWGSVRGGSQALLVDGEYLAFFHSCKNLKSVQSDEKFILHYFMGAYTFSPEPPFTVTRISPSPLVHRSFYDGPTFKTWKPLRVVFPGGYIFDENFIWISYGKQDHEIWIAKLDKNSLINSLKLVQAPQL